MAAVDPGAEDRADPLPGDFYVLFPEFRHVALLDRPGGDECKAERFVQQGAALGLAGPENRHVRGVDAAVKRIERVAVLPVRDADRLRPPGGEVLRQPLREVRSTADGLLLGLVPLRDHPVGTVDAGEIQDDRVETLRDGLASELDAVDIPGAGQCVVRGPR